MTDFWQFCRRFAGAAIVSCAAQAGSGVAIEPLDVIQATAQSFADATFGGADITVTTGRLDPRLRLAACADGLEAFLPPGAGSGRGGTVGVRCNGPRPWVLYVPVTVRETREVVVLARPLGQDAVIGADDLALERRDVSRLAGGYFAADDLPVGQVLRRPLPAGAVVGPRQVAPRKLVRRGGQVILAARVQGLAVRMTGIALADAAAGDRIQVRNLSSKRVVEGVVGADGSVEVPL